MAGSGVAGSESGGTGSGRRGGAGQRAMPARPTYLLWKKKDHCMGRIYSCRVESDGYMYMWLDVRFSFVLFSSNFSFS